MAADHYVGEIRMFAGTFEPSGWAFCNGQLLGISQNNGLYELIGTTYGGDGLATFGVPDLRSRIPMCFGQGKNLSPRKLGETGGVETVALSPYELPNHTHAARASSKAGNSDSPAGHFWAASPKVNQFVPVEKINSTLNENALNFNGNAAPHDNMPPFQAINFIIALYGAYPSKV
jgi:microcystin-dependent protein